jgi:hypothetical protein
MGKKVTAIFGCFLLCFCECGRLKCLTVKEQCGVVIYGVVYGGFCVWDTNFNKKHGTLCLSANFLCSIKRIFSFSNLVRFLKKMIFNF